MRLPPELIDHIFSFLRKDTQTLKACSAAHPSYSRLVERHLYMDIIVNTPLAVSELKEQFSKNPRLPDYPRTLEIHFNWEFSSEPIRSLLIMPTIPRMSNIRSLRITGLPSPRGRDENFISMFTICLQESFIEEIYLAYIYNFPLSVLDNGNNIKKLTLNGCTAKEEPIPNSPSSQQSLETLILSGKPNRYLFVWVMHRVARLTTLGLQDLRWTAFPGLLTACSNSLTTLHLDIDDDCAYFYDTHHVDHWADVYPDPSFTLTAFMLLESLSIFAQTYITATRIDCPLPAIIRLINTSPVIKTIVLNFHCHVTDSITSLGRLDWSLIDRLQSNSTGSRPRIDLCITADSENPVGPLSSESILDALAGNEALMGLVKRGLVVLTSERTLALWED